jgi:hypothetical protein
MAKLEALKKSLSGWMESSAGVIREIETLKKHE